MRAAHALMGGLLAAALVVAARASHAQEGDVDPGRVREGDPLRAQQLFDEAITLLDAGRAEEACPKFRESLAAEPAVGTLLNVAACSEREGRTLEAARSYRRVLELNAKTADDGRRRAVDAQAKKALDGLATKLSRVIVRVTPADARATITLDGNAAEPLRAGEAVEVLAGAHAVRVEAPGYRPLEQKIDAKGGASATVALALQSSTMAAVAPAAPPIERRTSAIAAIGWTTGLAGAGTAALGSVLLALASDRASELRALCGPGAAPPDCPLGDPEEANTLASDGQALAVGGYVALGVGAAALATGITLVLVDATSADDAGVALRATAGPGGATLGLEGRF